MNTKCILSQAIVFSLLSAVLCCRAADSASDNHVSKTESGFAKALTGFFNALGEGLEREQRERQERESHGDVTVDIHAEHGWVPIHLQRRGSGFVGPRGESYASLPERAELERTYGRTPPTYSGRSTEWSGTTVERGEGEVIVRVPGHSHRRIRTEGSVVKEWRVSESEGTIAVLSHVPGRDPVVQDFSLRDGRQRDRVLVEDIRNGRPAWASDFERPATGHVVNPMLTLRVNEPVRDGKVKGPRITVAGTSSERAVRVRIWDERNNRIEDRNVPTQNDYWNTQIPLERGRYRVRAEAQSGRDHEEFWFDVR